jgi:hypothetical protein
MKPGVFYDAEDQVVKAKQRIDYWLLVIGYLSFFQERRPGPPKPKPRERANDK